jgi:hypothetical protein
LPDFSKYNVPKGNIYIPNDHKICIPDGHNKYQYFPRPDSPKFTQIGILGLKLHHLATLLYICKLERPSNLFRKVSPASMDLESYFQ